MGELCRSADQYSLRLHYYLLVGSMSRPLTGGATGNRDDLAGLRRNGLAEFGKPFGRLGRRREPTHGAIELGITAICVVKILTVKGRKLRIVRAAGRI